METVIHPDIKADERLRPIVERANIALETWSRKRPKPERAVWWKDPDEFGQTLVRLEFRLEGDSLSRHFKPEELDGSFSMIGQFSELYSRLVTDQIKSTIAGMVTTLREWREEIEAEEEARSRAASAMTQEVA